jgi:hypothetical protein
VGNSASPLTTLTYLRANTCLILVEATPITIYCHWPIKLFLEFDDGTDQRRYATLVIQASKMTQEEEKVAVNFMKIIMIPLGEADENCLHLLRSRGAQNSRAGPDPTSQRVLEHSLEIARQKQTMCTGSNLVGWETV